MPVTQPTMDREEARRILAEYADNAFALVELESVIWDGWEELLNALATLSSFEPKRSCDIAIEAGRRMIAFSRRTQQLPEDARQVVNTTDPVLWADFMRGRIGDLHEQLALAEAYIQWFNDQLGVVRLEREAH